MLADLPISTEEILYAAILALCLTIIVNNMLKVRQIFVNAKKLAQSKGALDVNNIMSKCYKMFPISEISFQGRKYTRGMKIKITTTANTNFEGEFIGGNEKNMLCIKTNKYIIAHELSNIIQIQDIGQ
ncbi:MAG: hypothetical protein ACI4VF_01360 [Lachnospirales bacterium]